MDETWVKIYRKLRDSSFYHDSRAVHLWIHILLEAKYIATKDMFKGEEIILQPGQLITGRKKLSRETWIEESKIQRVLKAFEKCHMIEQQTNSQSRLITIVSWDEYQDNEQQMNSKRTANEQQMNTYIKKERRKEGKNKEELFEKAFEKWWLIYPKRNGRRIGKKAAKKKFLTFNQSDWSNLKIATKNYESSLLKSGLSPSDAHRFLNDTWKEYIEAADNAESSNNGNDRAQQQIEETRKFLHGE